MRFLVLLLIAAVSTPAAALAGFAPVNTNSAYFDARFPLGKQEVYDMGRAARAHLERERAADDLGELFGWECEHAREEQIVCTYFFDLPRDYCWYGTTWARVDYSYRDGRVHRGEIKKGWMAGVPKFLR